MAVKVHAVDAPGAKAVVVMDVPLHVHLVMGVEDAQDVAGVEVAAAVVIAVAGVEDAQDALDHVVVIVLEHVKVLVPGVVLEFVQDLDVIMAPHGLRLGRLNAIMALLGLM